MHEPRDILIVVAAVIVRDGKLLLTHRNAGVHLEYHWELPGGKMEPGEDPPSALARELQEELGVDATVHAPFAFNYHEYETQRVLLLAYITEIHSEPRPLGCSDLGWFSAERIPALATPPADVPIFRRLMPLLSAASSGACQTAR